MGDESFLNYPVKKRQSILQAAGIYYLDATIKFLKINWLD